ncbi:unnamed protein product [Caenorhabditis bovis]|uniref:Uncharacterized protein n=1 Tax=Caenorhabditis bovis TaxID=2654633 RepID=A0A8S1EG54_9PELO|nr:unnamed protein product [Caenorhabditis bovis]
MDFNGNSISDNPFLKHDGACKRLFRRRPIVIRDSDAKRTDTGFKMKDSSGFESNGVSDFEYGPGIVEKLRARFARLSAAQKVDNQTSQTKNNKKYSSCDNLLSDEESGPTHPSNRTELSRKTSRSISDMISNTDSEHANVHKQHPIEEEKTETTSISSLRQRFEKNGALMSSMRFARDPIKLVSKAYPDQPDRVPLATSAQILKPPVPAHSNFLNGIKKNSSENSFNRNKTSNVLKILNDAEPTAEPEFVQIARRLRRFQPEIHEKPIMNQSNVSENHQQVQNKSNDELDQSFPKWHRRQPEVTKLTSNAKIIRDACDISAALPTDPHSARTTKRPIPTIKNDITTKPTLQSSPPPEEPKPTTTLLTSIRRAPEIPIERNSIVNSVFKYDNPPLKSAWNSMDSANKVALPRRKIEDVGPKSVIASQTSPMPNIVSITVKGPVSTRTFKYDKESEDASLSSRKLPTTYSPSYSSVSLSTKYAEEKAKSPQQQMSSSLNGLLSPREKPYGDDVTLLKSDESDESSSSDDDSHNGNGLYEVTPLRPNSLPFTRLANEDEIGGDGNLITRSLISLVAEEDLPDFLVALHEKPVNYTFVEESEKPSTSSILRVKDAKKEEKSKNSPRIRFCTETPMAYAYLDECTAVRSLQWDNGEIVEYSYFKELEEREAMQNDRGFSFIQQWEEQIIKETESTGLHSDPSFTEALIESAL